jgi:uncharacterized protein (DUF1330 family)
MPAYFIVQITISDEAQHRKYCEGVLPLVRKDGQSSSSGARRARPALRTPNGGLEFPSMEAIHTFRNSPDFIPVKKFGSVAALDVWAAKARNRSLVDRRQGAESARWTRLAVSGLRGGPLARRTSTPCRGRPRPLGVSRSSIGLVPQAVAIRDKYSLCFHHLQQQLRSENILQSARGPGGRSSRAGWRYAAHPLRQMPRLERVSLVLFCGLSGTASHLAAVWRYSEGRPVDATTSFKTGRSSERRNAGISRDVTGRFLGTNGVSGGPIAS